MAGATTQADRQAQVLAAGYNGPLTDAAVNQAYANAATPQDLAESGISNAPSGGGGGGGGGGGAAPSIYGGVSSSDLSKITAGFQASAGMSQKQLDEQIREFDANLDWQKQMWAQQGLPQLAIQQRAQDLEDQKFAELTKEATRQQDFVEEQGRRQAALAEKTQSDANALSQQQLGLDTLKTAATLTGPQDWIKAANFSRGVAQTNLPQFVTQLMTGQNTATLGGPAPGAQQSAPVTMSSLAAGMGANVPGGAIGGAPGQTAPMPGNTTAGSNANQAVAPTSAGSTDYAANALKQLFAQGGQALGPQQIEGLTPTEMSMFTGGGADVGADVQGFLSQYNRSRIGQQAATPSMSA